MCCIVSAWPALEPAEAQERPTLLGVWPCGRDPGLPVALAAAAAASHLHTGAGWSLYDETPDACACRRAAACQPHDRKRAQQRGRLGEDPHLLLDHALRAAVVHDTQPHGIEAGARERVRGLGAAAVVEDAVAVEVPELIHERAVRILRRRDEAHRLAFLGRRREVGDRGGRGAVEDADQLGLLAGAADAHHA